MVALGQAVTLRIGEKLVVLVAWRRPAHQALQQNVQCGDLGEVFGAGDEGDTLQRVVMGDAEVIAGGGVLAADDDVAERGWIKLERAGFGEGAGDVEAPGVGFACASCAFGGRRTNCSEP